MSNWTGSNEFDCDIDDYYMDYPCPKHEVELTVISSVNAFQLKQDGKLIHQGSIYQLKALRDLIAQADESGYL
jgi:hypothetical protein